MIGEVIKEYLVSLGVQIDRPGFNQMQSTINNTSGVVSSATASWAKDFVKAGTIISTALASVSASIAGVIVAAAKQDLAMEKYSRSMLVSKSAALEMKTAIDALGESVQDIQLTPELMQRYRALVADGRNMKVGGDYESTMKNFRDLIFEFTRIKQEASYALQWVEYYLMKHLSKPLADAKATFKSFNDSIIKNMPVWTEKVARALVYIINIGKHFLELLKSIGRNIYAVWDAFPRGIKIATAALAGFFMLLRASPLGRMLTLFSSLLLLVDDYFGYMEGKQAAMGPIWDKLNTYMDTGKQKLSEWGEKVIPVWGSFVSTMKDLGSVFHSLGSGVIDFVTSAFKDLLESMKKHDIARKFTDLMERLKDILWSLLKVLGDCIKTLGEWFSEMAKSEELHNFIDAVTELLGAFLDLFNAIMDLVNVAFSGFFGEMGKTQKAYTFRDAVKAVVGVIADMARGISSVIRLLSGFFKMIADNRQYKEFWEGQAKAAKVFSEIVFGAIGMVGKLGRALLALVRGDFKIAAKLAGEAFSGKAEAKGRKQEATATEGEMWALAKQVGENTGINPEFVYAQWYHESAGFSSQLARENYNFSGLTQSEWNGDENKQPDGSGYYRVFSSPQEFADKFAQYILDPDYAEARGAATVEEYAHGLKEAGYYGATEQEYIAGLRGGLGNIPADSPANNQLDNNQVDFKSWTDDMHDPTWRDRIQEWISKFRTISPTAALTNGFANADPMVLNGLMQGGNYPAYSQNYGGGVTNVTYQVDVGGVNVTNANASASDIGKAVGDKTASSINDRAGYFLKNRALNGIQV